MGTSRAMAWLSLLSLACAGGKAPEQHAAAASKTVADTGATTNPPAELPMDVQHRTMDSVQANYTAMMSAVTGKDKAAAVTAAKNIEGFADRIPVFMIHKEGVAPDSLKQWAKMLKGQAMRVEQLASADSLDAATPIAAVMFGTCQTCHDMYRVPEADHDHDEHEHTAPAKKPAASKTTKKK